MKQAPLLDHDPAARRALDFYPTPAWMTLALLNRERMNIFDVLEPCCGDGAIADVVRGRGLKVLTNDIDRSRTADFHEDITTARAWQMFAADDRDWCWAVTNLPFNVADAVVPLAFDSLPYCGGLAFLLRLSWLEPTAARQRFLEQHPPKRLIVLPRHDFRGNGQTDSVTSAWFIWDENQVSRGGVSVVTKDERDELIAQQAK